MIGICTDSNSQLPAELAERYGVEVVPLTVRVDDREYLEGVDLDVDDFYELFADGHRPLVEFVEPSPGQFAVAYDDLIARGCTQVVSIHSARTLKAARLAAHGAPVQIRLVDARTARFGVSCCVWAAGELAVAGASLDEVAATAESLAPRIDTFYTSAGLELVARGGRAEAVDLPRLRIATFRKGRSVQVADAADIGEVVDAIATHTLLVARTAEHGANVAVGWAHRGLAPVADALGGALRGCARVRSVVRFRIGPSVGVDTGAGTVGCVVFPAR